MKVLILVFLSIFIFSCEHKASTVNKKQGFFLPKDARFVSSKARAYADAGINLAAQSETTITLQASVKPRQNMPSGSVQWKLPKGAKLVSGETQESVNLIEGQKLHFQIELEKSSLKEGDLIFFFAYEMRNGERHGTTSQYLYQPNVKKAEASKMKSFRIKKGKKIIQ